jgi:hypothetical protein
MQQFGGKDSKRHFTVVMGGKEHGLYVSSTPSSAARKAVTKLCSANKSKKVEFHIREITQGSKKKTYGPYSGYIEKLKEPIELKGRVIKYKPVAKLSGKSGAKKGGMRGGDNEMKLRFFPLMEATKSFQSRNYMFTDALLFLSPYKSPQRLTNMTIFSRNRNVVDYYWYSPLPIPNWQDGTVRKANYDKAIRNLQRLINEKPLITHFTISDNDNELSYNKLTDTNFEEYEWDFSKLD